MTRFDDPRPWGLKATTWQAFALLLLSALMLTNAAWFLRGRIIATEHAAANATRASKAKPTVVYEYRKQTQQPVPLSEQRTVEIPQPLADGERCMAGLVVRRIPDGWAGTGRAC